MARRESELVATFGSNDYAIHQGTRDVERVLVIGKITYYVWVLNRMAQPPMAGAVT